MRRTAFLLATAILLAACAIPPSTTPPTPSVLPTTVPTTAPPSGGGGVTWSQQMLDQVNLQRALNGAAPVSWCNTLVWAAQLHTNDQAGNNTMSHTGSDGSSLSTRVNRAGYLGWTAIGENVAMGYPTVTAVITAWMASSGHRANILNPSYTHFGAGYATSAGGAPYWTQDFGRSGTC